MPVSKDQARELAKEFLDLSYALSQFRFNNWSNLTPSQRRSIADVEWTLHNYSDDFTDTAVGLVLDEIRGDLVSIREATAQSIKIIKTIKTVRDVLEVTTGLVVLGGAIASQNPGAIAKAAADLTKIASKLIGQTEGEDL